MRPLLCALLLVGTSAAARAPRSFADAALPGTSEVQQAPETDGTAVADDAASDGGTALADEAASAGDDAQSEQLSPDGEARPTGDDHAPTASTAPTATTAGTGGSAPPTDDDRKKDRGFDALAIPLVSFNSDQGWGIGGVAGAYFYKPGYRPYAHGVALQTFFTSRGIQNHFLRYDGPELLGPVRVEARLEYRREFLSPFFGAGNRSAPDFKGDLTDPRFNYERFSPAAWVRFRYRPVGRDHPLELYAGYAYRQMWIRTYDGSLLEENHPLGTEGGPSGQVWTGAIWDTRNDEGDPTQGSAQELSLRAAHRLTLSRYGFVGLTASDRRYYRLSPRWVFAQRLILDALFGDVPFFEWPNIGGMAYTEGVGGLSSVRGVPRNRFAGNVKAISNSELRFGFAQARILGQPVRFGAVGFIDVGRVWHPDVDDGPWHAWHPGLGVGLRAARRAAVVRADYAFAPELGRGALYVTFGHMF